ncbi:hypothetical protein J3F83DRAFT_750728 [Trichoderma novae-zelandiae]
MPPFENAPPHYMRRTLRTWYSQVKPDLRDPELLWGDSWKRFNTMRIPVLPEDKHFERALEIAKIAKDREDFERIFLERNSNDWKELLHLMDDILMHASYHSDSFPCKDARNKVFKASQTGTLTDFIKVLKGLAFGWEADEIRETPIDSVPSGEEASVGAGFPDEGEVFPEPDDIDWEEERALGRDYGENVIFHGTYTYFPAPEPASRKASDAAPCAGGNEPLMQQKSAPCRTASTLEDAGLKETQRLQRKRKRLRFSNDIIQVPETNQASSLRSADDGSVIGETSPPANDNDRAYKRQKLDDSTTTSHSNSPRQPDESISKKRPIYEDDDGGQMHKRQKLDSSRQNAEAESNEPRISKRPISDDDDDDTDKQGHKRQKLDTSPQQHADADSNESRIDKSMSNKRPICDNDDDDDHDDDDDGDNEHRHKRQRLDPSSQQRPEANTNEPRISSKQRSSRSRRRRNNAGRAPEHIKTRSLNRIRPSTFWELDHTGKASIRI